MNSRPRGVRVMAKCVCCCPRQPHITADDRQHLAEQPENQIRNLAERYLERDVPIYLVRQELAESHIPFKGETGNACAMICCAACTRRCPQRCPQDVLLRAYLLGGNPPEGAPLAYKLLHQALEAEKPRYDVIAAMIKDIVGAGPPEMYLMDYSPAVAMEMFRRTMPDGTVREVYRPVADFTTGELKILDWPMTGMCPFCLPSGTIDRRRIQGGKRSEY